ncbi:MAG: 1-deoxy-D-xylulose-5-phosphate reductoisomerase [Pseudomonadota bacterium]
MGRIGRAKRLAVLGSTGSIGRNVLEIARRFPDRFEIAAVAAGKNIGLLERQIEEFRPLIAAVQTEDLADELRERMPGKNSPEIVSGPEGYIRAATAPSADMTVSAMVGAAGLIPTYQAILAGKSIALANKEVLVMAGEIIMKTASEKGVSVIPIDSEHSAVFQSLAGHRKEDLKRVILTASGGPFLNLDRDALAAVTPAQALKHPNWQMGKKVTIDSASLMNKGLEMIEAKWLFDLSMDQIAVLIHPQSIIHSMVEYIDGSVIAQLGIPDMRTPIAYALSFPERIDLQLPGLDLSEIGSLTFKEPDLDSFPCLRLAYVACEKGGLSPAALNAANEIAVAAFLEGRLGFTEIPRIIDNVICGLVSAGPASIEDILETDRLARIKAEEMIGRNNLAL